MVEPSLLKPSRYVSNSQEQSVSWQLSGYPKIAGQLDSRTLTKPDTYIRSGAAAGLRQDRELRCCRPWFCGRLVLGAGIPRICRFRWLHNLPAACPHNHPWKEPETTTLHKARYEQAWPRPPTHNISALEWVMPPTQLPTESTVRSRTSVAYLVISYETGAACMPVRARADMIQAFYLIKPALPIRHPYSRKYKYVCVVKRID